MQNKKNVRPGRGARFAFARFCLAQGFYWDSRSMTQATSLWKGGVRSFSTDSASVLRTPEAIGFLPRVFHHVTLKRAEGASSILREYSNGLISGIPRA